MPIYDYKCACGNSIDDEFVKCWETKVKCSACGKEMVREFPLTNASCFPADGITLEHVGPQPKTFKSKKEMVVFARKNNLELGALL